MIRHAVLQFKPHKALLKRNLEKLSGILTQLKNEDVDVITLPEASLSGYFLQAGVREQALEAGELYALLGECTGAGGLARARRHLPGGLRTLQRRLL